MTLREVTAESRRRLKTAGISNAAFEAACIVGRHAGMGRGEILRRYGEKCPPGCVKVIFDDVERRVGGEPLQYILGSWQFMGFEFAVGPGVLIPRGDTELLAEISLEYIRGIKSPRVLDLCFGSGCIGISLALMHENCAVLGVDISKTALEYAEKNIVMHCVEDRVKTENGDVTEPGFIQRQGRSYDLVVCNPPYIKSEEIGGLDVSVRDYEPREALDGGADGLKFYRALAGCSGMLKSGGMAVFEAGAGQAGDVAKILKCAGFDNVFIKKDYAGIERAAGGFARA